MISETAVGRPKKQPPRASKPPKTIGVRATGEWAEWLERFARHCRMDMAKTIDSALAEYAKTRGFDEKPPERVP